jgi:hypothetical protein
MEIAVIWNVVSCTMTECYLEYRYHITEDSHFQAYVRTQETTTCALGTLNSQSIQPVVYTKQCGKT